MISKEVIIGSNPLTLKEIEGILFNKYKISLSDKAVKAVSDSYQFLINFSKSKNPIDRSPDKFSFKIGSK